MRICKNINMSPRCPIGDKVADKRFRRTTIEMPEEIYKRIKALAIDKDMTLREIITEALEEKIEKEEGGEKDKERMIRSGTVSSRLIEAMKRFVTPDAAITLLIRKCEKYGYDPIYLEEENISEDFIRSLCSSMMYLSHESEEICYEALKSAVEGE